MTIERILQEKGRRVVTVRPDIAMDLVIRRMRSEGIGAVVVSEDGRQVRGILSERDILYALALQGEKTLTLTAGDLMSRAVVACKPDDSTRDVMRTMTERRIRHLPVVENGVLCGIVSIGDMVKNRLAESEMETRVLRDVYIASH